MTETRKELEHLRLLVADLTSTVQRLMQEKREHQWQKFQHCHGCEWCKGRESYGQSEAAVATGKK